MVRILLVEDNIIQAAALSAMLTDNGYQVIDVASTGDKALQVFRKNRPDLVILDIKINGPMDGIEIGKTISKERPLPIIYLTAYSENYEKAKITHPAAFFSKPYNERDLMCAIDLAVYNYAQQVSENRPADDTAPAGTANVHFAIDCLWIKTRAGNPFQRIPIDNIRWIAAANVYLEIYCTDSESPQVITMGISDFFQRAAYPQLLRIHRSYIVNRQYVREFTSNSVRLDDGKTLPISNSYRKGALLQLRQGMN